MNKQQCTGLWMHTLFQVDVTGPVYQVAAGHLSDESDPQGNPGRLMALVQCGASMLEVGSEWCFCRWQLMSDGFAESLQA